mgnify:CR=1 FL=1
MTRDLARTPHRCRGAAAVEFALVFPLLFLMLYGLLTFGAVFYTQLAVSRAVHDGARAVPLLPTTADASARELLIENEIIESLATASIAPAASNQTLTLRRAWLTSTLRSRITVVPAACVGGSGGNCTTITLSFPYSSADGTRLLPAISIPGIGGTETWIPDSLFSAAIVRL